MKPIKPKSRLPDPKILEQTKGFLDPAEGRALYELALASASRGPCLEVGSYCGKSALYLGAACRDAGSTLFSIDH
ncbi:MAG TPA: class I SAM-dependent methyltransferase, partial [Desulfobacterales bacterium]